jgi:hypothetical protein
VVGGLWFASPGCVIVLVGVVGIKCAFGVPSGSSKPGARTPCRDRGPVIPCPKPRRGVRAADRPGGGAASDGGLGHELEASDTNWGPGSPNTLCAGPT